ncbi:MAG: hypothetical protein FJ294_06215 [Planctomycetes bacterium]|nr:hypothetical protein [Planctomycetota bacterium]
MGSGGEGLRARTVWIAALALVALAVLGWVLATQETRALDGQATLNEWFDARELPDGLAVSEAGILPRGDRAVLLARPDAEEEPPRNQVPEDEDDESDWVPFDWSKVTSGAVGATPREVLVAELKLEHASAELEQLFERGEDLRGDWWSVPRSGGRRALERGKLRWGPLEAPYVLERAFEAGGTFRDTLRVNLTRERTPRILIARWTRGSPASPAPVQRLLDALAPRG